MKYRVNCTSCNCSYEVAQDFAPRFCSRCGYEGVAVAASKTKGRITAEDKMSELDELLPKLKEVLVKYLEVKVQYDDILSFLAQYYKRGVISKEEYDRYRIRNVSSKKDWNEMLREYREKRRVEWSVEERKE